MRSFGLAGLCALLLAPPVAAQDDRMDRPGNARVRSSPFDPPTEDVFVADAGPGLDTGCTFNTDSNHPLMIDILVDRAVGEVDANGYLVNPAALIADGTVPATVAVIMPAFDVDVNGSPPPENDEVFLNGERLGLLDGDDNIWKLNSFSIPVSRIKFPAPSPSGFPVPVANRVQINVDTLSSGRWCTAIDWVALVLPIDHQAAFKLEPVAGNKIRVRDYSSEETIDVIFQQSFEPACAIRTDVGPYDEHPFSGPANLYFTQSGTARLHTTVSLCPGNHQLIPKVKAEWKIAGTSLQGVTAWTGYEGDVILSMPDKVGSYDVELLFTVEGKQRPAIRRKLFVTWGPPLLQDPPRLGWYEKATAWAAGQSAEGPVLTSLLGGLYSFGQSNWRYGYWFDPTIERCPWQGLVQDPVSCDYSDCFVFSDVFESMAATLGIGGLLPVTTYGTHGRGFLTRAAPSLDPAFPGSAKRLGSSTYDRYTFSSHSLRQKSSSYYDATFNGIYSSPISFITANLNSKFTNTDFDGVFATTDEGWNVYRLPGTSYGTWGNYAYKEPPARTTGLAPATNSVTKDITFTGNATFDLLDADLDGIAEALTAEVEVQLNAAGQYTILGTLQKGGQPIANRPSWESMLPVEATLDRISGTYTVSLKLSGEQIDRSGLDGPYDLVLTGIAGDGSASATLATPPYAHALFGESPARLAGVSEVAVDTNGDGKYEHVEVTVDLGVRRPGELRLQGALAKGGQTLADAGSTQNLTAGARQVVLRFDGRKIRRSGLDGPYEGTINLIDAEGHTIDGIRFTTRPYSAGSFSGLLTPQAPFGDQGIDNNGNGLFDLLRIDFGADVEQAGSYRLTGVLRGAGSPVAVYAESLLTLPAGAATVRLDFLGPAIHALGLDGPYTVDVLLRDPATLEELDVVRVPQTTAAYQSTQFDPFGATNAPIVLTGNSSDSGVDTNGNGLYDELRVDVEAALARTDFYQWSARLVDVNGTEIGFHAGQATLNAGTANLHFIFDGAAIGGNGLDGPYFVKGLLIFGNSGANLVSLDVAATQPYQITEFEGAADVLPPRLDVAAELTSWSPPSRKYRVMDVSGFVTGVTDAFDPNVALDDVVITHVTSDEPDDAPGTEDGATVDDIVIGPGCRSVQLRAERAGGLRGGGNGRVYTIHVAAADASGNVGTASYSVVVPSSGGEAVDNGPAYTVEGCTP